MNGFLDLVDLSSVLIALSPAWDFWSGFVSATWCLSVSVLSDWWELAEILVILVLFFLVLFGLFDIKLLSCRVTLTKIVCYQTVNSIVSQKSSLG